MNRRRYYHPFLCSLLFLQSLSALCQITISTLEQDLQGIEETSDVVLTRLGNFVDESVQQGMVLDFGDQLRSQSGNTVVELNCPGGSLLTLSEKFRIVITPPAADQDCGITLLSGGADFLTDQSTSLESGEVTLGSKRTQYGMRVTRTDLGLQREVFVYDGEVEVSGSTSDQRRSLGGGKKLIVQASVWDERRLDQADLGRAATLHARVDTSKAKIATAEAQEVFSSFRKQYQSVLEEPQNPIPRLGLAVQQLNYGIASQATLYQLDRAEKLTPGDKRQRAMIVTTKGMAYQQLGNDDEARTQYQKAETIDASVFQQATLQQYKLDPKVIEQIELFQENRRHVQLSAIHLKTAARPDSMAAGRRTSIRVQATTGQGTPVEGAAVKIQVGGGVFERSGGTTVSGTTNARGVFDAVWRCSPCAGGYGFHVEVSKPGHEKATGKVKVSIR